MSDHEVLAIASLAIEKVARIAAGLGALEKREVYGRLGAELLIAACFLGTLDPLHDPYAIRKTLQFLRNIEKIFSGPDYSKHAFACLRGISDEEPSSHLRKDAETKIKTGILALAGGKGIAAEEAIAQIRKFTRHRGIRVLPIEEADATKRSAPPDHLTSINSVVYHALCEHMACTCTDAQRRIHDPKRHLARLQLVPSQPTDEDNNTYFDLLFSSAPHEQGPNFGSWQDVHLLIPRPHKRARKRARFAQSNETTLRTPDPSKRHTQEVPQGQFCHLITLPSDSCLCLKIEQGKLERYLDSQPLNQVVEHTPTISLASLLGNYKLTAKMKAALAYILAQSIWHYYDSDWMSTRWTSETVQFVKEFVSLRREDEPKIYASKPYVSIRFGDIDTDACESNSTIGELHRYPRARSLGIMLVEIGTGVLLPRNEAEYSTLCQTAQINHDLYRATELADSDAPWPDFDYPKYRLAVKNCLSPSTFDSASFTPNATEQQVADGLRKRKKLLYENVISPLEDPLHGTGWKQELDKIEPITPLTRPQAIPPMVNLSEPPAREPNTQLKSPAKAWLKRLSLLNEQLNKSVAKDILAERVRICILDTGYDADSVFFQSSARRRRIKSWKDWAEGCGEPKDTHGHGTYIVSLIMKIAPEADIFVARVAKDSVGLACASTNVAKAILWAASEWKVDVISMSFGFTSDQTCISKAIRQSINERDEHLLFFAAASNSGANDREMFPARHESVISVRGTNSQGVFQDFNPPRNARDGVVYGTLGLEIPAASLSCDNAEVCKSGTSVANAVMVGMVGVLLGYVEGQCTRSRYRAVREKLRTRQGILALLDSLATIYMNEGYAYITLWKLQSMDGEQRWPLFEVALTNV